MLSCVKGKFFYFKLVGENSELKFPPSFTGSVGCYSHGFFNCIPENTVYLVSLFQPLICPMDNKCTHLSEIPRPTTLRSNRSVKLTKIFLAFHSKFTLLISEISISLWNSSLQADIFSWILPALFLMPLLRTTRNITQYKISKYT